MKRQASAGEFPTEKWLVHRWMNIRLDDVDWVGGLGVWVRCAMQRSQISAPPDFISDGKAGFVVSHIEYALARDAKDTGASKGRVSRRAGAPYGGSASGGQRPAGSTSGGQPPAAASDAEAARNFVAVRPGRSQILNPRPASPIQTFAR